MHYKTEEEKQKEFNDNLELIAKGDLENMTIPIAVMRRIDATKVRVALNRARTVIGYSYHPEEYKERNHQYYITHRNKQN